jgi:hypothetical protein
MEVTGTSASASLFAITAKPPTLRVAAGESGSIVFTVSYIGSLPTGTSALLAHAKIASEDQKTAALLAQAKPAGWISIDGEEDRRFTPNSTELYTVKAEPPVDTTPGDYPIRLDMVGDESPDDQYTRGPVIAIAVTDGPGPPPRKWWLWIVIAAVALLVVGGTALTVALTHRHHTRTATLAPTGTPDTRVLAVSGVSFVAVDKNNIRIMFSLSKPGAARVRYGTSADLVTGTTIDAGSSDATSFTATFGISRESQYFYQITATDRFGASISTLVKPFKMVRTFTVTLTMITVKENHFVPPTFPTLIPCRPSYNFSEIVQYTSGTPSTKSFNFTEEFAPTVPKVYTVNHDETFDEDPARAITLTITGTLVPSGTPGCLGPLATATATLAPADDWQAGRADVMAESADMRVTFTVRDQLTPQFTA